MMADPQKIIRGIIKLCTFPEIAEKFNHAVQNPLTSNHELEQIIQEDAALTSRILRIANSAMFSFPTKIDTVIKAITIIGHRQTSEIILACSIVKMFRDIAPEDMDMKSFWHHAVMTACASRVIALCLNETNIERFFTMGLLHDIGRLVLLMSVPHEMKKVIELNKNNLLGMKENERSVLGFDHAYIGGMLLKQWKLPERVCEPVLYHHAPHMSRGYRTESAILHVADLIGHAMLPGNGNQPDIPELNAQAWDNLHLDVNVISLVVEQTDIQHQEAVRFILGEEEQHAG